MLFNILFTCLAVYFVHDILYHGRNIYYYIYISQVAADGGCERDVVHRMNEGYRA